MPTEGFVFSLALKRRYMQHIDCMSAHSVDMCVCVCVELKAGSDPNGLQWQAINLRTHDIHMLDEMHAVRVIESQAAVLHCIATRMFPIPQRARSDKGIDRKPTNIMWKRRFIQINYSVFVIFALTLLHERKWLWCSAWQCVECGGKPLPINCRPNAVRIGWNWCGLACTIDVGVNYRARRRRNTCKCIPVLCTCATCQYVRIQFPL